MPPVSRSDAALFFRRLSQMLVGAAALAALDANDADAVLAIQLCAQLRLRLVRALDDSWAPRTKRRWSLSENQTATRP